MSQSRPAIADRDIAGCVMKSADQSSVTFGSEPTSITFVSEEAGPQLRGVDSVRMSRMRTIVALLLVALILPGLSAGATSSVPPGPMIGGITVSEEDHLEAVAQAYFTCMDNAGLPVERVQDPNGYETIVAFSAFDTVMWRDLTGHSGGIDMGGIEDESREEAFRQFMYIPDTRPMLFIGETDYTDEYVKCLTISGYDDTAAYAAWGEIDLTDDPWNDLRKQAAADWISCAHRNGWPGIPDVDPISADVLLPSSMTEDQLRRLIGVCPNFSEDNARKQMEWTQTHPRDPYPQDVVPDPYFTVQISGLDAAYPPGWMPPDEKRVVADHIAALYNVLNEPIQAFYDQYNSQVVLVPT